MISDGGVPLCVFHRAIASEAVKAATSTIPGSFRLQTSTLQGNAGKTERDRVLTDEKTNRNSLVRSGSANGRIAWHWGSILVSWQMSICE